jgi:mannose-6-phosphate isomerase-like protein (cupin superfamily)
MNVREYIDSGILEEYCTGLLTADEQDAVLKMCDLFPEVKAELLNIEKAIERIATDNAVTPDAGLKQKILNSLGFTETEVQFDLDNLPVTHARSNHISWLTSLDHLIPEYPNEDFSCHVLRQDDQFAQMLIITKSDVPDETHDNLKESFFILKGECKCLVGENAFRLGPGDFLEIPLNQEHNVKMLTPYVVAILQYQYV